MSAVELTGLSASYGATPVLHGIDLALDIASCTAVLGPSGSGKSTLLRVLAGLHRPSAGSVRIQGTLVDDGSATFVPPERRGIGLVPQSGALFPHLSVARNIAFGLRGRPRSEITARISELVALTGLEGLERRMPHQLSGGQRQRVALARALAPEPALVLLDEPFSALDTSLRTSLRADVTAILHATGTTALLVTHDQSEAMSMADTIALLHEGALVQRGTPAEVYSTPATAWVGSFLGEATVLSGDSDGTRVRCTLGALPHQPGPPGPVSAMVRPEQVVLASVEPGDPARSGAPGVVQEVDFQGHDALVTVSVAGDLVRARVAATSLPTIGATVDVTVTGAARTFPA